MIKEILVDADGLVIGQHEYFSTRLAREKNVPVDKIMPFFKNEFQLCATGKADLRMEIARYLPIWDWQESIDDLLKFWFSGENYVDEQVMVKLADVRTRRIGVHLITDNEANRAKYIRQVMGLGSRFDRLFFSCELGHTKSQPEFFQRVLQELKRTPQEVAAWDDDPKNVEIMTGLGIVAKVYSNFETFSREIDELTQDTWL